MFAAHPEPRTQGCGEQYSDTSNTQQPDGEVPAGCHSAPSTPLQRYKVRISPFLSIISSVSSPVVPCSPDNIHLKLNISDKAKLPDKSNGKMFYTHPDTLMIVYLTEVIGKPLSELVYLRPNPYSMLLCVVPLYCSTNLV